MKNLNNIVILAVLLLLTGACKKNLKDSDGVVKASDEVAPDECVLKEPFLVFQNTHQMMGVAIHTSIHVDGSGDKKCFIKYKYSDKGEDSWSDYHYMTPHKFTSKGYGGEGSQDWYVWYKGIPNSGHFDPDRQVDYEVKVRYPDVKHWNPLNHKNAYFSGSFYTPPATPGQTLTFYAIGDTQNEPADPNSGSTNGDVYSDVMYHMALDMDENWHERYRLILHCGDFNFNSPRTYDYPIKSAWNKEFFGRPNNNEGGNRSKALWLLAHVPVMATIGNHDWIWEHHNDRNSIRQYVATFPYEMYSNPDVTIENACDDDWHLTDNPEVLYYSFDYGPAHFISLSTYPEDGNDNSTHFGWTSPMVQWLEEDLINTDKDWIFVFTHIPFISGNGSPYNEPAFNACEPLFQLYGVDAVLQGHFHSYVRRHYNGIPYFTLGGAGGELYSYPHPDADVYAKHHFFTRFDIKNNVQCYALTRRDSSGVMVNVDDCFFYNRQRK